MKVPAPPHVARLLQRLETLDAPAVQLWAWPGSGQQAVLDALVAAGRQIAQPLSLDDLSDRERLREVVGVAATAGARWLVLPAVPAPPRDAASALATLLPAGKRLVYSAWERRPADPVVTAWVGPRDHLLTAVEVATFWSATTGREPGQALVASLLAATDGWYRPLALLAERAADGGGLEDCVLTRARGVASFLRHEVLGHLSPAEQSLLGKLALAERIHREEWRPRLSAEENATLDRLEGDLGLLLPADRQGRADEAGVTRLPALLRRHLLGADEPPAADELIDDLARADRRRDEPAAALSVLLEGSAEGPGTAAAAGGELRREILTESWPELLMTVPRGRLAAMLGAAAAEEPPLRLLQAALAASSPGSSGAGEPGPESLRRLAAASAERGGRAVGVAAAAGLLLALLRGDAPLAGAEDGAAAALAPLGRLAAAAATAAELTPAEDGDGDDAETAAAEVALALARIEPPEPVQPIDLLGDGTGASRESAATGLAVGAVELLRRRAPAVVAALGSRSELSAGWRRWLDRPARRSPEPGRGYELALLGEGTVRRRDGDAAPSELRWPLKRAFKALAFLATQPQLAADRDALERALWPRDDAESEGMGGALGSGDGGDVERNFHPTLSHLRRGLLEGLGKARRGGASRSRAGRGGWPPPLLHAGGIYRLNPALHWQVDARELLRLLATGQEALDQERVELAVALWEEACGLYSAPFLAGYDDAWIVDRRERYQRVFLDLQRSLGETYARLGRLGEAMDALRTVLIADPLQERVHRTLMHVYGRQGRRDLVRRQYDRLTELLGRELSVEPQSETTAVYHRLMA